MNRGFFLVRTEGLEPTHPKVPAPKAGASANSATSARPRFFDHLLVFRGAAARCTFSTPSLAAGSNTSHLKQKLVAGRMSHHQQNSINESPAFVKAGLIRDFLGVYGVTGNGAGLTTIVPGKLTRVAEPQLSRTRTFGVYTQASGPTQVYV